MTYLSKSNDSFKSRLRFYLFEKTVIGDSDKSPNLEEFLSYDLKKKKDIIKRYTAEFFHTERKEVLAGTDMKIDEIYIAIKEAEKKLKSELPAWRKTYYNQVFKDQFTTNKFKALSTANQCHYCEITIDEIIELIENKKIYKKNERGWKMEIDRKDPNQEYSDDNCVPACYWCNNAKTDEFNAKDFKLIGLAIGETLRARLPENRKS
jgi:5-methylcytosine-specific restriction endonuclease McrA